MLSHGMPTAFVLAGCLLACSRVSGAYSLGLAANKLAALSWCVWCCLHAQAASCLSSCKSNPYRWCQLHHPLPSPSWCSKYIMPVYLCWHSQTCTVLETTQRPASCRWRWMAVKPNPSLAGPPSEAAQLVAASGTPRSSQMMKLRRMCAPNSALLLCQAPLAMHALQVCILIHPGCTCTRL